MSVWEKLVNTGAEQQLIPDQLKIISLKPLYDFIHKIALEKDPMSALSNKREYSNLCRALVGPIDRCQGFYLWGRYDRKGLWINIYLGKAGHGKIAYLKSRKLEELIDKRMCFWLSCYPEDKLLETGKHLHGEMWSKYAKNAKRAFLKAGSTHIAWTPTEHLNNRDVLRVEADLIEAMNPIANLMRPAPPSSLQADTRNIFEQFGTGVLRRARHQIKAFKPPGRCQLHSEQGGMAAYLWRPISPD